MIELNYEKIHINYRVRRDTQKSFLPRRYTLTHSDFTGDLYLTIDREYDEKEISHFYTKLMRDEVLAEWKKIDNIYEFHIYVHVSGGFVFGWAGMRDRIFRHYLPHTIRVMRYADDDLFSNYPALDKAPILVHFESNKEKYNKIENYGIFNDYS
jgi:hypothetical protein